MCTCVYVCLRVHMCVCVFVCEVAGGIVVKDLGHIHQVTLGGVTSIFHQRPSTSHLQHTQLHVGTWPLAEDGQDH